LLNGMWSDIRVFKSHTNIQCIQSDFNSDSSRF
jgi:hypothetical protein